MYTVPLRDKNVSSHNHKTGSSHLVGFCFKFLTSIPIVFMWELLPGTVLHVTFLFVVFIWVSQQDYKFLLPVNFNLAVKAWAKPEQEYPNVMGWELLNRCFFSTRSKHVTNAREIMPSLQMKFVRLKSDESTQSQWRLSGTIV